MKVIRQNKNQRIWAHLLQDEGGWGRGRAREISSLWKESSDDFDFVTICVLVNSIFDNVCVLQWRSQGGHWAIAQCLEIYCPKIFGDDGYCPVLKKFDRNPAFKNSVEFSQISYSLIGFNRTECNLTDNKIFLYLPSAFRSKHMYSTNN